MGCTKQSVATTLVTTLLATAGLVLVAPPAQAAIAYRSAATADNGVGSTSLLIAKPSGAVWNDVLVAQITFDGGTNITITPPTGWTLVLRTNDTTQLGQAIYTRTVALFSEPSDHTWTLTSTRATGGITAYSGVNTSTPVDKSLGQTGIGTTYTAPSVTTTSVNGVLLALYGIRGTDPLSQPSGMTERYERQSSSSIPSSSANSQALTATGATGTRDSTGVSYRWIAHSIALRAAGTNGCSKNGTTVDVALGTTGDASISRSGNDFNVSMTGLTDTTCGGATVANVDLVDIVGGTGANNMTINLSGGQLEPGAATEGTGLSEIELDVDLSSGTDKFTLQGGVSNEFLDATSTGIKTDSDADDEITLTGVNTTEIRGGDGNDTLKGSPGAESLFGEAGNDMVVGGDGTDSVDGGVGDDLVSGGASADTVVGGDGNDSVLGRLGSDDLSGDAGNDTLSPGGGTSNDAIDGGADRDTVDYARSPVSGASTGVTVNLGTVGDGAVGGAGDQNTVAAGSDDLVGIESILGSFYDDTLTGDTSNNFFFGWGGNDIISGLAGNDALSGGDGNDSLSGGDGSDQFYGAAGTDTCDGGNDVDDFASDEGTCETELNAP